MKQTWIFIIVAWLLMAGVACGDLNPESEMTSVPSPNATTEPAKVSSGTGRFFAINEVGLGTNGFVALTNFTDTAGSLAGLYLCQGFECFELPDVVVDAGETVRIAAGDGTGHEAVVATGASLGDLRPSDGEIALFASPEPDNPGAMLRYLQWGSTPHDLTQTAIDAGLWVKGGYGPSSENATLLFKDADSGLWLFSEE